jgi:hypothetical protein
MLRARPPTALLGIGAALVVASTIPVSCWLPDFAVLPAGQGGAAGGATGGSGAGGEVCEHATWPVPSTDAPDGGDLDFAAAVRWVDIGETDDLSDGPTIGYDLDGRCSCQGQEDVCSRPEFAPDPELLCDGPRAVDNNAARVFAEASTFVDATEISSEAFSSQMLDGDFSVLIRVRDYNGGPDDAQVRVALYPSPGLRLDPCNAAPATPSWDGDDRWPVHATALEVEGSGGGGGAGGAGGRGGAGGGGGMDCSGSPDPALDSPRFFDDNAYVANGTLVASVPKTELTLSGGDRPTKVTIVGGFLTARIENGVNGRALRGGLLVGRWSDEHVLGDVASIISEDDAPLCTDDGIYNLVKSGICKYMDIEGAVGGPTAPCDAISFGIAFEAEPAKLGSVHVAQGTPVECEPGTDPADDRCTR